MLQEANHFQDPIFANAVMEMTQGGNNSNSPSDIAWHLCNNVQSGIGLDDVILYLINEEGTELVQTAAAGPKNPSGRTIINPIRIPVGDGIVGSVAKTGRPELIGDTSRDPRYILDDENRYSEISIPIIQSDRLIGVIDSENYSRKYYNSNHLAKLELMASIASGNLGRVIAEIRLEEFSQQRYQLEQIAAQQLEVKEQLDSMGNFLSRTPWNAAHILSHELRTPLNAIMSVSDLLGGICERSNDNSAKELTPFAGILRRNSQDLLDRITNLLDLPNPSRNSKPIATREVNITQLLRDLFSRLERGIIEQGLSLELDIPSNATTLRCDPIALRRVIYGLIDNAAKFSGPSGTVLVRLIVDPTGSPTQVVVIDQGIGIDSMHITRIFEPFFQVDQGMTRQYGGLGLGLPIARRLCTDMGYELTVHSLPGQGSTFEVNFHSLGPLTPAP